MAGIISALNAKPARSNRFIGISPVDSARRSERIPAERRHKDVIRSRDRGIPSWGSNHSCGEAISRERQAADEFPLEPTGDPTVIAFVEVLPEAHGDLLQLPV